MALYKEIKAIRIRSTRDFPRVMATFPQIKSIFDGRCPVTKKKKYKINLEWNWSTVLSSGDWLVEDEFNSGRVHAMNKEKLLSSGLVIK